MLNRSTRIAFRIRVLYFIQLPEYSVGIYCIAIIATSKLYSLCFFDFLNAICNSNQYSVLICSLQTPCKGFYKYNAIIKLIEALFHKRTFHSREQGEVFSVLALFLLFLSTHLTLHK